MLISGSTACHRSRAAAVAAALICSALLVTAAPAPAATPPPVPPLFVSLLSGTRSPVPLMPPVPAPRLDWSPCVEGGGFDCARAKVPLDYRAPGRRSVELAVVRRKATGPGRREGTLFFNPGGPGGPGTVQMPQSYELFPREVRERFDIVSWDPRGVGASTAVRCFDTAGQADAWSAGRPAGLPVGAEQRASWIAAFRDLSRRCEQRDPELLRHVSTADTARDLDQLRRAVGDPQLTYLGVSYGTILGATYANLFPGTVRAMVLDSNIDPAAWTDHASPGATTLPTFLRMGTDLGAAATLDRFLALCGSTAASPAVAGSATGCAFSAGSPRATRAKFDALMRRLRARPLGAWTYGRTVGDVMSGLYVVHPGWTDLARTLQDLWQGRVPTPAPTLPAPVPVPYLGEEQAASVLCSDSPNPRDTSAYPVIEERAAARAGDAGRYWTWAAEACATWPARAADGYTGPWDHRTAHPVLVVGTTFDPATPYRDARAMAEQLADARLLTVDGYGHTALDNPSRCVAAYESRYFVDGSLPPAGATCRQDVPPFQAPKPHGGLATGGGATAGSAS